MTSPFTLPPPPAARQAAAQVIEQVHDYMRLHPESELHQRGKMFGVLIYDGGFLAAFSAMLDGSYFHEGFVPPVIENTTPPVGHSKDESQRLQQLLFAQYNLLNAKGESKNLLDIFRHEKPIIPSEQWFNKNHHPSPIPLPPSGAGECCAPKLLQYAFSHQLTPLALAEFWVGAPPKTEIRQEGTFYTPCSGRCVPILRHMLQGLPVEPTPAAQQADERFRQIEVLFEDDTLIVINKPAGLLSVPGKSDEPSVETLLHAKPVHRLDQDTSGLLVLAKTPEAYKTLQSYFQRRDILKRYEAILCPNPPSSILNHTSQMPQEGTLSLPLLPNPYDRPRQMVNYKHGKPAITRYVIREQRPDGTLRVDFFPLTGRTHQLRIHAAHPDGLNAPILGDRLYGATDIQSSFSNPQSPSRLFLHAAEITFPHPLTHQLLHFSRPLFD